MQQFDETAFAASHKIQRRMVGDRIDGRRPESAIRTVLIAANNTNIYTVPVRTYVYEFWQQ